MTNGNQERRGMKKIKVELTVERRQRLAIRHANTLLTQTWCDSCGDKVAMVSGEEAAKLVSRRSREIYSQAEQGLLHSDEKPDGTLLICVKSLLAWVNKRQIQQT
jgi:hypothetical protein